MSLSNQAKSLVSYHKFAGRLFQVLVSIISDPVSALTSFRKAYLCLKFLALTCPDSISLVTEDGSHPF